MRNLFFKTLNIVVITAQSSAKHSMNMPSQHTTFLTHHMQRAGLASALIWWGKPTLMRVWSILLEAGGGSRCSLMSSLRWRSLMDTEKDPPVFLVMSLHTWSSAARPTTETRMLASCTFWNGRRIGWWRQFPSSISTITVLNWGNKTPHVRLHFLIYPNTLQILLIHCSSFTVTCPFRYQNINQLHPLGFIFAARWCSGSALGSHQRYPGFKSQVGGNQIGLPS